MSPRIRNTLIGAAALMLAWWLGGAIAEGNYLPLVALGASVASIPIFANTHLAGGVATSLYYSGLSAPGIPGQLNLYYVASAAVIVATFARLTLVHKSVSPPRFASYGLLVGLWLVVIMGVRGSGFRVLGSETWGGVFYVRLLMGIVFVWAAAQIQLPPKRWRFLFNLMIFTAFLPLVADILVIKGWAWGPAFLFLRPTSGSGYMAIAATRESGVVRYLSAGTAGVLLTLWICSRHSFGKLFGLAALRYGPLLLIALVLGAASGFRLRAIEIMVFILFMGWLQRGWTALRIFLLVSVVVLTIASIYPVARYLPMPAQRSLAWLPGVEIDAQARLDAEGTVDWRLELWRAAIKEAPDYLWIGKGYAFKGEESIDSYLFRGGDEIRWAVVTSAYHNGPLSMLVGLGIPGLIVSVIWIVSMTTYAIRTAHRPWKSPMLRLMFLAVCARLLVVVSIFFTLYGDVQVSFPEFLFLGALMCALRNSDNALAEPAPALPKGSGMRRLGPAAPVEESG